MRGPRRSFLGFSLAFFCALTGLLPSGTWALCVEMNGHVALETQCRPIAYASRELPAPLERAPDGCLPCRDIQLKTGLGFGLAGNRQFVPPPVAANPPQAISSAWLSEYIPDSPLTPPGSPLGALQGNRTTTVLRI